MDASMNRAGPAAPPGWYRIDRNVQRWWNGASWSEEVLQSGRPNTVTRVRRFITIMIWLWIALGLLFWIAYLVMSFIYGSSLAFVGFPMAITGTLCIVVMGIFGPIQLAKFPPTIAPAAAPRGTR